MRRIKPYSDRGASCSVRARLLEVSRDAIPAPVGSRGISTRTVLKTPSTSDCLCQAKRYERSADRVDTRAGHYERKLQTKAWEVSLQVPQLRSLPFESQIIERWPR